MIFTSTKRECAASRFLTHRRTTHHHIANVYSLSSCGYFTRVFNRKEPYGTHSNCNQRSALIVAFVAVALNKRSSELPKEKKTRKKRQPKEVIQEA
jgi:hypothetical protein